MKGHAQSIYGSKARRTRGTTTQSASRVVASVPSSTAAPLNHIAIDSWGELCELGWLSCSTRAGLAGSAAGG
eukprot:scaffold249316_cov104-Cyclotella_meneghiniana.AAC.1